MNLMTAALDTEYADANGQRNTPAWPVRSAGVRQQRDVLSADLGGRRGTPLVEQPGERGCIGGGANTNTSRIPADAIGAALPAAGPPDPTRLADIYRRHHSEITP